jgi:hypothetical protein
MAAPAHSLSSVLTRALPRPCARALLCPRCRAQECCAHLARGGGETKRVKVGLVTDARCPTYGNGTAMGAFAAVNLQPGDLIGEYTCVACVRACVSCVRCWACSLHATLTRASDTLHPAWQGVRDD